jgi:hypothetical protein
VDNDMPTEDDDDDESLLINIQVCIHIDGFVNCHDRRDCSSMKKNQYCEWNLVVDEKKEQMKEEVPVEREVRSKGLIDENNNRRNTLMLLACTRRKTRIFQSPNQKCVAISL